MKEIDINIEGYNVNGICVGCLNYKRKMYDHEDVKECYRILGNIDVPDGLQILLCWECSAAVRNAMRFRQQILSSYDFLINYSKKYMYLNSPNDFEPHAKTHLTTAEVDVVNLCPSEPWFTAEDTNGVKDDDVKDDDVKDDDVKEEDKYLDIEIPIKEELSEDMQYEDFAPFEDHDVTSDDDIQLSKLKEKESETDGVKREKRKRNEKKGMKERLTRESKRKLRKLKNLPEDLVQLYTMSEEEMWLVRAEDVASEEFQSLKYKCEDCVIGFNTKKLMKDHMNGKHQSKGEDCHQCDVCKAYFLTKDNVSSHRSLHLAAYRCGECGARTALKRRMARHAAAHCPRAAHHACHTCGIVFSSKSKLTYHRSVKHQERPQCDCCGKVFANKMTLKYHLKILPQNKQEKPKEKLYIPCKGCDKVFHSKKSYRAHAVIHEGVSYPCPVCGKLFQWKRNLARHARNHRERDAGARHECRPCRKTFASRDCYNNHMRLSKKHVAEDTYQHECNYCSKKFATKWCLTDHIDWDHLKRIKYQCSVCFKAFKTAKIMVAHVNNIHEGRKREPEGEHLCEICGKSYKTEKRLKGHVWAMHTKRSTSKSFKCKLCPATFTWQTSIYKHMKMMHDVAKKVKQPRTIPSVKKEDPYPGIELANRMQYYPQNIAATLNIVHIQPLTDRML